MTNIAKTELDGIKLGNNETLSVYDEGTWTPSEVAKANLTGTSSFASATYTRIGNTVFARIEGISGLSITTANIATYLVFSTTGLPEVVNATKFYGGALLTSGGAAMSVGITDNSGGTTDVSMGIDARTTGTSLIYSIHFSYKI
jgi:hypothetical protein